MIVSPLVSASQWVTPIPSGPTAGSVQYSIEPSSEPRSPSSRTSCWDGVPTSRDGERGCSSHTAGDTQVSQPSVHALSGGVDRCARTCRFGSLHTRCSDPLPSDLNSWCAPHRAETRAVTSTQSASYERTASTATLSSMTSITARSSPGSPILSGFHRIPAASIAVRIAVSVRAASAAVAGAPSASPPNSGPGSGAAAPSASANTSSWDVGASAGAGRAGALPEPGLGAVAGSRLVGEHDEPPSDTMTMTTTRAFISLAVPRGPSPRRSAGR